VYSTNPVVAKVQANKAILHTLVTSLSYIELNVDSKDYVRPPFIVGHFNGHLHNPQHIDKLEESTTTQGLNSDCLENVMHVKVLGSQVEPASIVPMTHNTKDDGTIPTLRFRANISAALVIWHLLNGAHRDNLARTRLIPDVFQNLLLTLNRTKMLHFKKRNKL
jgi:hypothetical protein